MHLVRFRHKGLRQLWEDGSAKGLTVRDGRQATQLLFALETAATLDQLRRLPGWKLHPLRGERQGFWSLTVTGN